MAAEVCGARLIAPFYGSSLYVWSAVMAITLGGLATGYFMGGQLSLRANRHVWLQRVVTLAIVCLVLMPFLPSLFYLIASHLSLIPAVVCSVFLLLFPTMVCMGATSPLIIACLTEHASQSGENSGKVYAVSTVGGIAATFFCGFYSIPQWGLRITLACFAGFLLLAILVYTYRTKTLKGIYMLVLPLLIAAYGFVKAPRHPSVLYETEGVMGTLDVREEPEVVNPQVLIRKLAINQIVQTEMDVSTHRSVSAYAELLENNLAYMPTGKALVLGLGGGVVSNMLQSHGYKVTAVEFDSRIIGMAKTFFYLDPSVQTVADDARHYINTCHDTFQLVLFDIFKAEEQPAHVLTLESLQRLKQQLSSSAVVMINTHGYLAGDKGKGTQCMLATLKQAGFDVRVCATGKDEDFRNLLIYASLRPFEMRLHDELHPYTLEYTILVNTDMKPMLEMLNAPANQVWRSHYISNYILYH